MNKLSLTLNFCALLGTLGCSGPLPVPASASSLLSLKWSTQAYLKAPNTTINTSLGYSVALSQGTLIVGAVGDSSNQTTISNLSTASFDTSSPNSGAAFVFQLNGVSKLWFQQSYIKVPNALAGGFFGSSVAISEDTNTMVVGSIGDSSSQNTITTCPGLSGCLALSMDTSLPISGAAYVFIRSGVTWILQAYLKPPNPKAFANFGSSVSISGNTVVVGSIGESSSQKTLINGSTAPSDTLAQEAGAVYVFQRTISGGLANWAQQAYLKAPNAQALNHFGSSLGISGDTLVVGSDLENSGTVSVVNGATAASDQTQPYSGAAYVFQRTGTNWARQAYLKASNSYTNSWFGHSVAVSGDTIVVGAYGESSSQTSITNGSSASSDHSALQSGAAYIYQRSNNLWAQTAYLKAPNALAYNWFGMDVSISGSTAVVGSLLESSNQSTITNGIIASSDVSTLHSGAAYVFLGVNQIWAQQAYLKAPNPGINQYFGAQVAVSGNTIAVGSFGETSSQSSITNGSTVSSNTSDPQAGATYVFLRK